MADSAVHVIAMRDGSSYGLAGIERSEFMGIPCLKGSARYIDEYRHLNGNAIFLPVSEVQGVTAYASEAEFLTATRTTAAVRRRQGRRRRIVTAGAFLAMVSFWLAVVLAAAWRPKGTQPSTRPSTDTPAKNGTAVRWRHSEREYKSHVGRVG